MKHLLWTLALIGTLISMSVSAAGTGSVSSNTTGSTPTQTQQVTSPLLLKEITVNAVDTMTLRFNQSIQVDTLRVRVSNQATGESVKVSSITGALDKSIAKLSLTTLLKAGDSYVLTILAVYSTNDTTISSGVDAIREFVVPMNVPGITLSAPPNPTAVITQKTGSVSTPVTPPQNTGSIVTPKVSTGSSIVTATGKTSTWKTSTGTSLDNIKMLPQAGSESLYLVLIASIFALFLLFRRKNA